VQGVRLMGSYRDIYALEELSCRFAALDLQGLEPSCRAKIRLPSGRCEVFLVTAVQCSKAVEA
jgi:hypothetical protein